MEKEICENTLVDGPRLNKLIEFLSQTKDLPGEIAEIGVYKGGTAFLLAKNSSKHVYLFDTFEGMPKSKPGIDLHQEGDFKDTSLEKVQNLLKPFNNVSFYKGIFPKENSEVIQNKTFSLVHLDCDIYDSVKESLEFFYPRMNQGGIIVFDDYNEPNCPGAKLAVNEFFQNKLEKHFETTQSQAAVIKL